ncbi:MAG: diguanylate cyclase [Syntrophaceae bacterium]|nr:diguanylate cyclase [Syntrophaceae bacterium]
MKILVAEDDAVSRRILEATLAKWDYQVISVDDGRKALKVLEAENAPELAILDWMMPEMEGVEICKRIRSHENRDYVYMILITAKEGKENLISGLEAGADDYLVKPFDHQELRVRLHSARRILKLQKALLDKQEILKDQATHDPLTGLWNRAAINGILDKELDRAIRDRRCVSLIMADIDHFKRINDNFGHPTGDRVLKETTRRISETLRTYDAVGRYGGEEFICVLPGCKLQTASKIAERIRVAIESNDIDTGEGKISVTISLGVAAYRNGMDTGRDVLIKMADTALYLAKNNGRNRVEIFSEKQKVKQNIA